MFNCKVRPEQFNVDIGGFRWPNRPRQGLLNSRYVLIALTCRHVTAPGKDGHIDVRRKYVRSRMPDHGDLVVKISSPRWYFGLVLMVFQRKSIERTPFAARVVDGRAGVEGDESTKSTRTQRVEMIVG